MKPRPLTLEIDWRWLGPRLRNGLLVMAALTLLAMNKADPALVEQLQTATSDFLGPTIDFLGQPIASIHAGIGNIAHLRDVFTENAGLRDQNHRLIAWQDTALRLEAENAALRSQLHVAPDPAVQQTMARVIGDPAGGYVESLMLASGTARGIQKGQPAVIAVPGAGSKDAGALVGRVIQAGSDSSRLLLITDVNSRIPVLLEQSHIHAILGGDDSDRPVLMFLPNDAQVAIGERLVTSGNDRLLPPGIAVGIVVGNNASGIRVAAAGRSIAPRFRDGPEIRRRRQAAGARDGCRKAAPEMIFGIGFSSRWMHLPRQLLPVIVTLLLAIVQLLPWSRAADAMTPSLVLMSVVFWSLHAPRLCPPLFACLIGAACDLTELTPLGSQALVFLILALELRRRPRLAGLSFLHQWVLFAGLCLAVNVTLWLIELGIGSHIMPLGQAVARSAIGIVLYPILVRLVLLPLHASSPPRTSMAERDTIRSRLLTRRALVLGGIQLGLASDACRADVLSPSRVNQREIFSAGRYQPHQYAPDSALARAFARSCRDRHGKERAEFPAADDRRASTRYRQVAGFGRSPHHAG